MLKTVSFILLFCFIYCDDAYSTSIIRDSEVEAIVKELARPLFHAAGLDDKKIKVLIVRDNSINAFVVNNESIFINLGLLRYSTEPYVLLGILAHEIAHISAGHILQMNSAMNHFKSVAMMSYALGLISGIAVDPQIASAILLGGVTLGTGLFFYYSQEQESIADSYALRYLDESGYDNIGMKEAFSYFKSIEPEITGWYFRTHPLSDKRLFAVQNYKVKNKIRPLTSEQLSKFKRIVMKLDAFFTPIHMLSSKYQGNSKYINAIIYYRQGRIDDATELINSLAQDDPYLYELKAEMLYKSGRLDAAIENYEKSLQYLSNNNSYLVKLALSHTLLLNGNTKKAISYLKQIIAIEQNDALALKYLKAAYKRNSKNNS
ncbi:MAG: M48 family metalloprotease [Wolbachia endosymbiont of Tyrophagus putrescentiae]|nr:M48 family metalloprotease [Wolbachia endosymbiont of Tyrophagus putrescentiae]